MKTSSWLERSGFAFAGCSTGLILVWLVKEPIGLSIAIFAGLVLVLSVGTILTGHKHNIGKDDTATDVSRPKPETALHTRERLRQQLIDVVPAMIWCATPEGELSYASPALLQYAGLENVSDLDVAGQKRIDAGMQRLVHVDDKPELERALAHSFTTGEPARLRYRQLRADGTYRWTDGRLQALRDEDGKIVQWYGVALDIDDEITAAIALREREREFSQLVNMVPSMLWRLTPEGEPNFFNQRLIDALGLDISDTDRPDTARLATLIQRIIHPDDAVWVSQAIRHSLTTGERFAFRYRMRRADGSYMWVEGSAEPLRGEDGRILQWFGLTNDIDDQVRAEEELRLAQERLSRASQAASLAELSASIAHEVNQPLAAVVANSHACQRWLTADPPNLSRALTTVERIIGDANAAAEVVSRIRALFKQTIESQGSSSLEQVVTEVRRLVDDLAVKHRVLVDICVEQDLPQVAIDRVQIQQVLTNLARNALEAMGANAGTGKLSVRAHRTGAFVQVGVIDNGPGIEHPEKIFDAFFTTKESGMGMGLAISRSIVESHGGRLWVEKNDSGGSTFFFTLPIQRGGQHEP